MAQGRRLRLVLLDRDGVINHDSPAYIKSPAEWLPVEGSLEAIARMTQAGLKVAVVTNQAGVARGKFDLATLMAIHARMHHAVDEVDGRIDAVFFCPHHPDAGCGCRKPAPGMLLEALARFDTEPQDALLVGDSLRDLEAAAAAGVPAVLVRTGNGAALEASGKLPDGVAVHDDLAAVADALLAG